MASPQLTLLFLGTHCTQPPSDGAVTEATDGSGCLATRPCLPHPSYGHFCPLGALCLPGWLQRVVGTRFPLCPNTKCSRGKGLLWGGWGGWAGDSASERGGPGGLREEKGASGVSASVFVGCFPFSILTDVKLGSQGNATAWIYSPAERYQKGLLQALSPHR